MINSSCILQEQVCNVPLVMLKFNSRLSGHPLTTACADRTILCIIHENICKRRGREREEGNGGERKREGEREKWKERRHAARERGKRGEIGERDRERKGSIVYLNRQHLPNSKVDS